jgi:hypothetical protein
LLADQELSVPAEIEHRREVEAGSGAGATQTVDVRDSEMGDDHIAVGDSLLLSDVLWNGVHQSTDGLAGSSSAHFLEGWSVGCDEMISIGCMATLKEFSYFAEYCH